MDLSTLKPAKGSVRTNKRRGRGQGSGLAGTAGRGHKGAQSRSGYKVKFGFEGGQMPLQRRVPKFGFNSPNKVVYKVIDISRLQTISEAIGKNQIALSELIAAGLVNKKDKVKILGNGALEKQLEVEAHAFSKGATKAIEDAGGKISKI